MPKQVDRSPTGSGVTARIALQYHKGLLELNQTRAFKSSATGSVFTGKAVRVSDTFSFSFVNVLLLRLKRYVLAGKFLHSAFRILKQACENVQLGYWFSKSGLGTPGGPQDPFHGSTRSTLYS